MRAVLELLVMVAGIAVILAVGKGLAPIAPGLRLALHPATLALVGVLLLCLRYRTLLRGGRDTGAKGSSTDRAPADRCKHR